MNCKNCNLSFGTKSSLVIHESKCKLTQDLILSLRKDYLDGVSLPKLRQKYKCSKNFVYRLISDIVRTKSESSILAHKLYPEKFKLSDETKLKLRNSRLKWMRENPERTAWRTSKISYPEKLFVNKIRDLEWDKKYLIIREKSVFPFFIDFAFENHKIAIEIDGSQHLEETRKERDNQKDELLVSLGWKVIRFTEKEIKINLDNCINTIEDIIVNRNIYSDITKIGIFHNNQIKVYCETCKKEISRRSKKCIKCSSISPNKSVLQRKVERPSYEQLLQDIENLGYLSTGKKYNVSDNAVRKWIRMYQKHGLDF